MPPVTVFSKAGCQPCRMTKIHLKKAGIEFEEVDVTTDPDAVKTLEDLGYQQVPVVMVGDESWSGLRMDRIKELAALASV